jgi:hypothetical protein
VFLRKPESGRFEAASEADSSRALQIPQEKPDYL